MARDEHKPSNYSKYTIFSIFSSFLRARGTLHLYIRTIRRNIGNSTHTMADTIRELVSRLDHVGNSDRKENAKGKIEGKAPALAKAECQHSQRLI
jgi:hypothetical protein